LILQYHATIKTQTRIKSVLTAIFDPVEKGRGFTAYFVEFPNIVAQERAKDEAIQVVD